MRNTRLHPSVVPACLSWLFVMIACWITLVSPASVLLPSVYAAPLLTQIESGRPAASLRQTTVGIPLEILGVVIPGEELRARGVTDQSPALARVVQIYPHGTDQRYDLEFRALEPGRFNVLDYLETSTGQSVEDLEPVWVDVMPLLSAEQLQPHPLRPGETPSLGGYRLLLGLAAVIWLIVLFELIRRNFFANRMAGAKEDCTVSLPDELKSLIEQILKSNSSPQKDFARLEALLLAYWRERLDLENLDAHQAIRQLHQHPEAGEVLRQVEDWLHRPNPPEEISWEDLLRPYFSESHVPSSSGNEVTV